MGRSFLWLLLVAVLGGCVSARATMLVPAGNLTPVPPEDVRIYLDEDDVPESCEQIALINAEGNANATNRSQMLEAIRRRAGSVGANAVVTGEVEEPSTGRAVASALLGISADRRTEVVAYLCDFGSNQFQFSCGDCASARQSRRPPILPHTDL